MKLPLPDVAHLLDKRAAPILIVNDEVNAEKALVQALKDAQFHIITSKNPEEALVILQNTPISIVVAYHKAKGTSGIHLLSHVKEHYPNVERILVGDERIAAHLMPLITPAQMLLQPLEVQDLLLIIEDRFRFFQLRHEHSLLSNQLLKHGSALKEVKSTLIRELALGEQIHKTLLVDATPQDIPGVKIAVASHPSGALDGDFISFFRPSATLFDFVIGDVMGKGLPSALVGTAIKGCIGKYAQSYEERSLVFDHHHFWHDNTPSIKSLIQQIHQAVIDQLIKLEFYVSLFLGRIDLEKRVMTFIDCGYTKPLYYRKTGQKSIFIRSGNFPLGTVQRHEYFPFEVHFEEGDFFVFYSDGIIEAASPQGELYGEKRLGQIVEHHASLPPEELAEKIKESVIAFTKKEVLEDDFTLLVIQVEKFHPVEPSHSGVGKFNSTLNQLEAVRDFTKELCSRSPGNLERLSSELKLAIDEVFTNIVMHGYDSKAGSPICISRVYLPEEIVIEISDQGRPFNPFEIPSINLYGDQDHGYGWHLIRQIADRVVYTPKKTQNGWNRLSLFKKYYTKRNNVMEFTPTEHNGILIIQLDSETLDAKQVAEFKEQIIQILEGKGMDDVVFDLHKLQFIDSSGLGAFLSLFRHLNMKGGHLALAAMNKSVKSIFELVSMQKIFDCHETLALALSSRDKSHK